MPEQLPIVRYAAVTKTTKLSCVMCTNEWQMVDFPDHTRPRTLFCPWCGEEQVYPADKPNQFCENEADNLMDIINTSSLTTERDRELFKLRVQSFVELHLATAPREQLEAIEREMLSYRPTADHRK